MPPLEIEWRQEGDEYYAETPYGKAIITEMHSSPNDRWRINTLQYAMRIRRPNGIDESLQRVVDNLDAAKWMMVERLQALSREHEQNSELTRLLSTIELCREFLSSGNNAQQLDDMAQIEAIIRQHFGS